MARVPPVPTSIPSTWITPPRHLPFGKIENIIYGQGKLARETGGGESTPEEENPGRDLDQLDESAHFAGHDEERPHFEAGVMRAETLGVVVLLDVDDLFRGGDGVNGHVVVAAVFQNDQAAVNFAENEIEREIAVSHGNDGIDRVGIAAAYEVTQLLVDDLDFLAVVVLGRNVGEFFGDEIADAT